LGTAYGGRRVGASRDFFQFIDGDHQSADSVLKRMPVMSSVTF